MVHFRYGPSVPFPQHSTPPRGDAVEFMFRREQSNSTGGTLTHVETSFTGAGFAAFCGMCIVIPTHDAAGGGVQSRNGNSCSLAGGWRWNDVLRFPGLEVVIGLDNFYVAVGGNVNPRPFAAWRRPGLTFANQSHYLIGNIREFVK